MGVFGDQAREVCIIIGVEDGASPTSAVGTMSENLGQVLRKVVGPSSRMTCFVISRVDGS